MITQAHKKVVYVGDVTGLPLYFFWIVEHESDIKIEFLRVSFE